MKITSGAAPASIVAPSTSTKAPAAQAPVQSSPKDVFGGSTNDQIMSEWTKNWVPFMHDFSVENASAIETTELPAGSDAAKFAQLDPAPSPDVQTMQFYKAADGSLFGEDTNGDVGIFDATGKTIATGNVNDNTGFVKDLPVE